MSVETRRIMDNTLVRNFNVTRELAITQFKLKYTGSVLGYVWSLIKPLMIFAIMYAVFDIILKVGRGTVNFPLQLLVAVVLWTFFAETTNLAVVSITTNGSLVQRAFFPRSILVIANSASAAMTFLINITLIVVVAGSIGKLSFGLQSLAMIPLVIELYLLILGTALLVSSLYVYFRDLAHIWEILLQILFYASGVVFPVSVVGASLLRHALLLNPIAQIIEDSRHAIVTQQAHVDWTATILGGGGPGGWQVLIPIGLAFGVFALGSFVFSRLSPQFAENL